MSNARIEFIRETFQKTRTDKAAHGYAMIYAKVPADIHAVLEIGVQSGASLIAWAEIFPQALIYGIDKQEARLGLDPARIEQIQANIREFYADDYFAKEFSFDLIVDDGSHILEDQLTAWHKLYRRCRGLYIIEDVELEHVGPLLADMEMISQIISVIQTRDDPGSRVVVAQYDKVIEW